jgi:hypothetical protein
LLLGAGSPSEAVRRRAYRLSLTPNAIIAGSEQFADDKSSAKVAAIGR